MLVTIVAIAALAVVGFGVPLGLALATSYRNAARASVQRQANQATSAVSSSLAATGRVTDLPPADAGTVLTVYDRNGQRVAGEGPAGADQVVQRALGGIPSDGFVDDDVVAAAPVEADQIVIGAVRATQAESTIDNQILRAGLAMAALAALVLAAAIAAALLQSRRLARPLERLAATAQNLGDGDFTSRNTLSGVPEIDAAAHAMDRTAERLGRLVDRERAFSADVSHQLRTPLTGLRLTLDNALSTPGVDPTAAMTTALQAIDRLEITIDDLLELARDTPGERADLQVDDILHDVAADWRGRLSEEGRGLQVSVVEELPSVKFSGPAFRQVVNVLVANSVEHGEGDVSLAASAVDALIAIEVRDDGPGITTDIDAAFVRRADRDTHRGIGLALARSLAEAEGGTLVYRSEPPRFLFMVPTELQIHPPATEGRS